MLELKISFGTFFGLRTRRILIDLTRVNDLSKHKAYLSYFSDKLNGYNINEQTILCFVCNSYICLRTFLQDETVPLEDQKMVKKVILSYPASQAYNHHHATAAVGNVNGRCSWQLPSANRNEKRRLRLSKFECSKI